MSRSAFMSESIFCFFRGYTFYFLFFEAGCSGQDATLKNAYPMQVEDVRGCVYIYILIFVVVVLHP